MEHNWKFAKNKNRYKEKYENIEIETKLEKVRPLPIKPVDNLLK